MKKVFVIIIALCLASGSFFGLGMLLAKIKIEYFSKPKTAVVSEQVQNSEAASQSNNSTESQKEEPVQESEAAPQEQLTTPTVEATPAASAELAQKGFTFAEIGDTQSFSANPNGNLEKAAKSLSKQQFDFVIATGDLLHSCDGGSGCDGKYSSWKKIVGSASRKIYAVQGNHDRTSREKSDSSWSRTFSFPVNGPDGYKGFVYSFDYQNSHFVALDSEKPNEHIIDKRQRDWLEQDLNRNTKENIFVFFHESAFQMCQDPDSLASRPSERDALWDILKRHRVTAVFNGHCHMFSRKIQDGIHQFLLGDTDSTADDIPQPGAFDFSLHGGHYYALVSVLGKQIDYKLYSVDGKLLTEYKF